MIVYVVIGRDDESLDHWLVRAYTEKALAKQHVSDAYSWYVTNLFKLIEENALTAYEARERLHKHGNPHDPIWPEPIFNDSGSVMITYSCQSVSMI